MFTHDGEKLINIKSKLSRLSSQPIKFWKLKTEMCRLEDTNRGCL